MYRCLALILLLLPLVAEAKPKKPVRRRGGGAAVEKRGWDSSRRQRVVARGATSLVLEAVDLRAGRAVARVAGVSRPPAARLFTFHDDRERHFIALEARCQATLAADQYLCELDLPRPYLQANVRGFTLHIHQKEIAADGASVAARFAEARRGGTVAASVGATAGGAAGQPVAPGSGEREDTGEEEGSGEE